MKKLSVFFVLLIILAINSTSTYAKTVYITNNLDLPLRDKESSKAKIISLLPIGTPIEVLNENSKTGFTHARLKDGMEGFVVTRNTMMEPPSHAQPETIAKNLGFLQTENNSLKEELAKVKASLVPGTTLEQTLASERNRLDRELTDLKRTASNQIQLKNERDQLQEDVVGAKRELEQLKLENNALKGGASQDWFLYGGFLALAGVILGFILPKISWRRKNNWDRF